MTTTTPSTGQTGNNSSKNGDDNANANAKAKAKSDANREKQKKKKQKDKEKRKNNNNNNNNHVKYVGLIAEGIMNGVTINPVDPAHQWQPNFGNLERRERRMQQRRGGNTCHKS